jgi:putative flippase GtrA
MPSESRSGLARELLEFGIVGGLGFVIDVAVFNVLRTTVFAPTSVHAGPVIAKAISTSLAIIANWTGNRLWTFRATRREDVMREGLEFAAISVAGMTIAVGCLWISHYLLGLTSLLDDNISSNVVGLLLGAAFRFVLYRWWVFAPTRRREHIVSARLGTRASTTPR